MRTRFAPLCVIALAVFLAGGSDSASLQLVPEKAAPGQAVTIKLETSKKPRADAITRVTMGDRSARIVAAGTGSVVVIIPALPPGAADLGVYAGRSRLASGRVEIAEPPNRRFLFALQNDRLELLGVTPTSDEPDRNVRSRAARLSFDLVDASGRLIYSTSVPDPAGATAEAFRPRAQGGGMSLGQARVEHRSVFPVRLPAPPDGARLLAYRAPAGLEIFDARGRGRRVPLGSFSLERSGR